MLFVDDNSSGHDLKIRPGFLKQNIYIDGQKVPKKLLHYTFPFQLISSSVSTTTIGNKPSITVYGKDSIDFSDGKVVVNGHELNV